MGYYTQKSFLSLDFLKAPSPLYFGIFVFFHSPFLTMLISHMYYDKPYPHFLFQRVCRPFNRKKNWLEVGFKSNTLDLLKVAEPLHTFREHLNLCKLSVCTIAMQPLCVLHTRSSINHHHSSPPLGPLLPHRTFAHPHRAPLLSLHFKQGFFFQKKKHQLIHWPQLSEFKNSFRLMIVNCLMALYCAGLITMGLLK